MSGVIRKSQQVLRPDLGESIADITSRLYTRERDISNPPANRSSDLSDVSDGGWLDDGMTYAHDFSIGQQRPSAPQAPPWSYPGPLSTTALSGAWPVVLGYIARIYMVAITLGTSGSSDTTVVFYLNGSSFTTLTLISGATIIVARNPGTWPTLGGNETDILQVATTAAGSDASDLVANVRIV